MRARLGHWINYLGEPRLRSFIFQLLLLGALLLLLWMAADNALTQLAKQNISTGFGFLSERAGFDVHQSLIEYTADSSYGTALWVGLLNTLLVAVLGIIIATGLGFAIGIARLSKNKLIYSFATLYIEIIRNIPLLLQIFFWYFAVFSNLPLPKQSVQFAQGFFINRRGVYMPELTFEPAMIWVAVVFVLGLLAVAILKNMADKQQQATGTRLPLLKYGLLVLIVPPAVLYFALGQPMGVELPSLRGFNFQGGVRMNPEFSALLLALSTYTAAFIAEVVRAGLEAVKKGQIEAGRSLGLKRSLVLQKIIIPQAMRVIIPPLTSQYLNLTKNSSLAVAIAYPDLVSVFAGTVLNQTGQALEIIFITMSVYLIISITTSWTMNMYNNRLMQKGGAV